MSEQSSQGTLFGTTVEYVGTDPATAKEVVVFDDSIHEGSPVEAVQPKVKINPENYFDSNEIGTRLISDLSEMRKLQGQIKQGYRSAPVARVADKRRKKPEDQIRSAQSRIPELDTRTRDQYELWRSIGARMLQFMGAGTITNNRFEAPHYDRFVTQHYGSSHADNTRRRLIKNLKK